MPTADEKAAAKAAAAAVVAAEAEADAPKNPNRDSAIGTADTGPGFTTKAPPTEQPKADAAPKAVKDLENDQELLVLRGKPLHEAKSDLAREHGGYVMSTIDGFSQGGQQIPGNITAEANWASGDTAPTHSVPRTFGALGGYNAHPAGSTGNPDGPRADGASKSEKPAVGTNDDVLMAASPRTAVTDGAGSTSSHGAWDPNHEAEALAALPR